MATSEYEDEIAKLRDHLEKTGWIVTLKLMDEKPETGVLWHAYKQMPEGSPYCRCNDHPPFIYLEPWIVKAGGRVFTSATLEFSAEAPHGWIHLESYNVSTKSFDACDQAFHALVKAWAAING